MVDCNAMRLSVDHKPELVAHASVRTPGRCSAHPPPQSVIPAWLPREESRLFGSLSVGHFSLSSGHSELIDPISVTGTYASAFWPLLRDRLPPDQLVALLRLGRDARSIELENLEHVIS